ncbi:MAG: hypothetical protein Q9159_000933 [Coniocarpon cinnabarinum]
MLPTPNTDHISSSIYPPSEDSYLFLDALSAASERQYLTDRFRRLHRTPLAVEIGTGSGLILASLTANAAAITGRQDLLTVGVDVNVEACRAGQVTVEKHCDEICDGDDVQLGVNLGCITADLGSAIRPRTVDVLLFNPPYVPSDAVATYEKLEDLEPFDLQNTLLALATDGGADGMEVTDRLLAALSTVLGACGVAYVLLCRRNQPEQVVERVKAWQGSQWAAEVVRTSGRTGGLENLCIVRIARDL